MRPRRLLLRCDFQPAKAFDRFAGTKVLKFEQLANFNLALRGFSLRRRESHRSFERLFSRPRLNNRVAGDKFLRLREGVDGPQAGLALIDALADRGDLDGYHLLHAARADLLRRLAYSEDAAKSYARPLALVTNDSERRHLERRLHEVQPPEA